MNAALGLVAAGPAAGARAGLVAARGAGRAADRRIALDAQRVARQAALDEGARQRGGVPGCEGIHLDARIGGLEKAEVVPAALEALAAVDPGAEAGERPLQRQHLAKPA